MKIDLLVVGVTVFAPPALQAETVADAVNTILSTERIFSAAFLLFLFFLVRQVWPWYVEQAENKQKLEFDYKMGRLAIEERAGQRQDDLMERLIASYGKMEGALLSLNTRIDALTRWSETFLAEYVRQKNE